MHIKKALVILLVFTAFYTFADDFAGELPPEMSSLADDAIAMVVNTISASQIQPASIFIAGIEYDGDVPAFGRLFAMTVASRLANRREEGIQVRSSRPVESLLDEILEGYGDSLEAEPGQRETPVPDYVVYGSAFNANGFLHIVLQLIDAERDTVIKGLETSVAIEPWLEELLRPSRQAVASITDAGGDMYEPDSIEFPLEIPLDGLVEGRTIAPEGDLDWYVIDTDGLTGENLLNIYTTGDTDTYIIVYGPDNPDMFLAENDDSDDSNASVTIVAEDGQTFWVRVSGYDESITGGYSFHSSVQSFEGDLLEPNNTIDDAAQLSIDSGPLSSMIMPGSDEDWYVVEVEETPGPNTIMSVETYGELDTYMEFYTEEEILLLNNDDGGDEDNARVIVYLDTPGKYFVKVRHYDGTGQGAYEIEAQLLQAEPDQYEPDDNRSNARPIGIGGEEQYRNFTPADDVDWAFFTLPEAKSVTITTRGSVDTFIRLFDRLGNPIVEDDDSGDDYNAKIERLLQKGDYYIQIEQVEGDSVFGAEYYLTLTAE